MRTIENAGLVCMVGWKGRAWIKLKLATVHCSAAHIMENQMAVFSKSKSVASVAWAAEWKDSKVEMESERKHSGCKARRPKEISGCKWKELFGQTATYEPFRVCNKFTKLSAAGVFESNRSSLSPIFQQMVQFHLPSAPLFSCVSIWQSGPFSSSPSWGS